MDWFSISKAGLAKLLERKGKSYALYELLQNALDEQTTLVEIELARVAGTRWVTLMVKDDSPEGFKDLSHAFTMFAESAKKGQAEKRGRFNVGEKLVLAACEEARIESTTGTIIFDSDGRRRSGTKTERGSVFTGRLKMTNEEMGECAQAITRVLIPPGVTVLFNGQAIASREPMKTITATLPTEIADAEGYLRKSTRQTTVEFYEPAEGEVATLYEMGIPVVETGDRFHINVLQKVPLPFDRDGVPPAYMAKVRALAVEQMTSVLGSEDANSTWVKDAVQRYGKDMPDETINRLAELRFGEKRVAFDPSDAEANHIAVAQGYQLVYGSQLSKGEWEAVRRSGAILPAGRVTPSPKPYSEDGKEQAELAPEKWSARMHAVVAYSKRVGLALLGKEITVRMVSDVGWWPVATFGGTTLTFNLGRLGHKFFDGDLVPINELLIHEFGHSFCGNHLDDNYHRALTRLGAKLSVLALEKPQLFVL